LLIGLHIVQPNLQSCRFRQCIRQRRQFWGAAISASGGVQDGRIMARHNREIWSVSGATPCARSRTRANSFSTSSCDESMDSLSGSVGLANVVHGDSVWTRFASDRATTIQVSALCRICWGDRRVAGLDIMGRLLASAAVLNRHKPGE
jgi:hypothetical protein